jgi:hypothetical protein
MAQYGIDVHYPPPATPHRGGHIEWLIDTMMGALRILPGATGCSVAERGQDPETAAAMTLDKLETWLLHQIVGVYHHSVHRGLGMAPITAWTEAVAALPNPHQHRRIRTGFSSISFPSAIGLSKGPAFRCSTSPTGKSSTRSNASVKSSRGPRRTAGGPVGNESARAEPCVHARAAIIHKPQCPWPDRSFGPSWMRA